MFSFCKIKIGDIKVGSEKVRSLKNFINCIIRNYESQNKNIGSSAALCKVTIVNPGGLNVYFDCINYGESSYDYGILSKVGSVLSTSSDSDSSSVVHKTFSGSQSPNIQTVEYGGVDGVIYVKYKKDGSVNSNNDSLQFTVRIE